MHRKLTPAGGSHAQRAAAAASPTYFFCVSAGVVPCIYWLGSYKDGRFDMDSAAGPFPLDLGDVIYAPNLLQDAQVCVWGEFRVWSSRVFLCESLRRGLHPACPRYR